LLPHFAAWRAGKPDASVIVEIGTKICTTWRIGADMRRTRGELVRAAEKVACKLLPHASFFKLDRSGDLAGERYQNIVEELSNWRARC